MDAAGQAGPPVGGDITDTAAIFAIYGRRCYSVALHLVRDRHLAEDVVQDVFESLFRNSAKFDPLRGSVATWVLMLTHHRAVDLLRSHGRKAGRDTNSGVDFLAAIADIGLTPEELACLSDETRRVRLTVRALPPIQRDVIMRTYFGGQTQREAAEALGIPLGTVKSRATAGMLRLAQALEAEGLLPTSGPSQQNAYGAEAS